MLQDSGVPATLTVRELVDLFRVYYPAPMTAADALGLAGLEDQSGTRAGALSGGERQRLYFALAVCGNPPVLFLDEPTVAMDVSSRIAFLTPSRDSRHPGAPWCSRPTSWRRPTRWQGASS